MILQIYVWSEWQIMLGKSQCVNVQFLYIIQYLRT